MSLLPRFHVDAKDLFGRVFLALDNQNASHREIATRLANLIISTFDGPKQSDKLSFSRIVSA